VSVLTVERGKGRNAPLYKPVTPSVEIVFHRQSMGLRYNSPTFLNPPLPFGLRSVG
jgi:hypothetical protein